MVYPRWRQSLARSLHVHRSKVEATFFQVASICINEGTNELSVQNRTVVFRGFDDKSSKLLAITDIRTNKYAQWLQRPQSEICWYFAKSREQYRINCGVSLVGPKTKDTKTIDSSLRLKVWESLSEKAHSQFLWPTPKEKLSEAPIHITSDEDNIPETFVVIVFNPISVDYLNLTTVPQTREIHGISEDTKKWVYTNVNP